PEAPSPHAASTYCRCIRLLALTQPLPVKTARKLGLLLKACNTYKTIHDCYLLTLFEQSRTRSNSMTVIILIPARVDSTRLPGKPLADIAGKPMIAQVAARALES